MVDPNNNYAAMIAQGWTDQTLVQHNHMVPL